MGTIYMMYKLGSVQNRLLMADETTRLHPLGSPLRRTGHVGRSHLQVNQPEEITFEMNLRLQNQNRINSRWSNHILIKHSHLAKIV